MKAMVLNKKVWIGLAVFTAWLMTVCPLAIAGSISGQVTGGGGPLANVCVNAVDNLCQGTWYSDQTDASGNFSISGLPEGTYYVTTHASCASPQYFVDEWWDGGAGVFDCNQAAPVGVTAAGDTPGINFSLQEGGMITGMVTDSVGLPVQDICLDPIMDNPCGWNWMPGTRSNADGTYAIVVLPGTYYVRANPSCTGQNYVGEWWDNGTGCIGCSSAAPVVVALGLPTGGIDFQLEPGGSVSGHVSDDLGNPIPNLNLFVQDSTCGGNWLGSVNTDQNGNYTAFGLPGGDVYVGTCAHCTGLQYVDEWYDNTTDCNQAAPVPVVVGQDTPGISFQLAEGGTITGQAFDPLGNPAPFVPVSAFTGLCYSSWAGGTQTDQNGNYSICLPPGDYYVVAEAKCHTPFNGLNQWWDSGTGTTDCNLAAPVTVTVGSPAAGIDFFLMAGASYPAPIFERTGMFSILNPDGTRGTVFYGFPTGPSPEDVCSFTVTGPSGTFDLQPFFSFRQMGLMYLKSLDFVTADGRYEFRLTDSMGRTAALTRDFVRNDTVPVIDPGTMYPPNMSYVGTTPILGADPPVTAVDSAASGALQYQVMVRDYHSRAIWYASAYQDVPTFQVPDGLLQPNTPYFWFIRVIDTATEYMNRTESQWYSFFTGPQGVPLLENPAVLSMTIPPYGPDMGYWLGVMSRTTAPWDVDYLRITDGASGVYDWTGRIDYWFSHPCYYSYFMWGSTPILDGNYAFEMQDWATQTGTTNATFTYAPVPPVAEETRYPEPNAYMGANTPLTFSWAPLVTGDTSYLYRLRIRDFNERIVWYDSPYGSETSVTVPEGLLPSGSSYKWQVMVMDTAGSNLAYTLNRTFTLNAFHFPKPDVKVNGQDGPVFLPSPGGVEVEISLDAGDLVGEPVDWWIGVLSSIGNYWFGPTLDWIGSSAPISVGPFGLFDLAPYPLLIYDLPTGIYTFFFVLDQNVNGVLDDLTWYDYVNVFVSPDGVEVAPASISEAAFLEKIQGLMK